MKTSRTRARIVRALILAVLAACISVGAEHGECPGAGLCRPGRPRIARSRSSSDLRRVHRLRHRRGNHRADRGSVSEAERDGLPQRRALHAQRPERGGVSGVLDKYGAQGLGRDVNVGSPGTPVDSADSRGNRTPGSRSSGPGLRRPRHRGRVVAYAEYLNDLGALARQQGQNLMIHNHNWEFQACSGTRRRTTSSWRTPIPRTSCSGSTCTG